MFYDISNMLINCKSCQLKLELLLSNHSSVCPKCHYYKIFKPVCKSVESIAIISNLCTWDDFCNAFNTIESLNYRVCSIYLNKSSLELINELCIHGASNSPNSTIFGAKIILKSYIPENYVIYVA